MNPRNSRFAVCLGLALASAASLGLPRAAMAVVATLNTDIDSYVLFAFEELNWKGGNAVGTGFINGGNVGVNRADSNPGDSSASANVGANGRFIMSDNTQLSADSLRFGDEADVWNVFANHQVGAFTGTIRDAANPAPIGFTPPILAAEPGLSFTPGRAITELAANVTVPNGTTLPLGPGDYRDVQVQNDATLVLGDGVYNLRNLTTGQDAEIIVTDQTELYIDGRLILNDDTRFGAGTTGLAIVHVGSLGVASNNRTINISEDVFAVGQFFAPNGIMNFGRSADGFGRFWAETITSDFNVNLTYVTPDDPGGPHEPPPTPEPLTAVSGMIAFAALGLASLRRRK